MKVQKVTKKSKQVHGRWYGDACGTAFAMELVGERWSLLIVRELMLGGRRFSDIRASLPGISAKVLAERLDSLEAAREVVRRQLPAPGKVQVYELTEWGYAAEPLIQDPVYFKVDARGRLWVVEMGDYPLGVDGSGKAGGRIRILTDDNGDGRYDSGVTFLDGLRYPTGVLPWKDGAFVSHSPDIFFAKDEDGDGTADSQDAWVTGFKDANPQHRVNGFAWGLDNWIYLAMGDPTSQVTSLKTDPPRTVDVSGRDVRFNPFTGEVEAVSGLSQYGRVRDDWGNWFGNTNSEPLKQYVVTERDMKRNPYVAAPSGGIHLTDPAIAPPVTSAVL